MYMYSCGLKAFVLGDVLMSSVLWYWRHLARIDVSALNNRNRAMHLLKVTRADYIGDNILLGSDRWSQRNVAFWNMT